MWTGVPFLEGAYEYMSAPQGDYGLGRVSVADDAAASFTLVGHDFAPNETLTIAVANYWIQDLPTSHVEVTKLAHQLNKWMGYGRGDVNSDDMINLTDIIYLANYVGYGGPGPIPFSHLGDVNASGAIDGADVNYLVDYYFSGGACPAGEFLYAD